MFQNTLSASNGDVEVPHDAGIGGKVGTGMGKIAGGMMKSKLWQGGAKAVYGDSKEMYGKYF